VAATLVALLSFALGQRWDGALFTGAAVATAFIVAAQLWTPFPPPLMREHWPMRLPVMRRLARRRHWANPFYAEVLTLRCAWRPSYTSELLQASVLRFPWIPIGSQDIAGYVDKDRFLLKRMTFWANGARPTAFGRLRDAAPGTNIEVTVAAPAATAYVVIGLMLLALSLLVLLILGSLGIAGHTSGGALPFVVVAGLVFATLVFGVAASPIPIGRSRSEADRYLEFFAAVLGADLVSRA
jgi:hypothetical protein